MKRIILLVLLVNSFGLFAQTDYYWYRGQKVFLERLTTKKFLLFDTFEDSVSLKSTLKIRNMKVRKFNKTNDFSSLKIYKSHPIKENKWAVIEAETLSSLNKNTDILYEAPFYLTSKKVEAGLSHLFYVKLNKLEDISILEKMALDNNVDILGSNKFMPLWYTLACSKKSKGNALQMADLFYESQLYSASEPDLMTDDLPLCVNDTYFTNQWGLNNTGQNSGTVGLDINYCQARQITTGNQNVIVAVLDQGVELNHPDLINMHPSSYDTESGTSPSQVLGDHGTACAGIIGAASNNSLGVTGIAPSCRIMSISNSLAGIPNSRQCRADGFNFASQNGASVISNSWGSAVQYQIIDDAINNALTQGRNGLGCVIVFSSGNDNGAVSYPANSNSNIIAVGAISPCGQRKSPSSCDGEAWGGNFGSQLDIMAPGVLIPTTDRQGTNGYNTANGVAGDYIQDFNGTSSACPHVAAIAALILSVNPNLTQLQVADIIGSTAQKVGGYSYQTTTGRPNGTWNNEMGYGLIDAFEAVKKAGTTYLTGLQNSKTISAGYGFILNNVTINYNSNVSLTARKVAEINGTFEVPLGSTFEIKIDPLATTIGQ